jgi:hypothetical protein
LRDAENEAMAESATGDIEAAAHHAFERHLVAASGTVDSLGAVVGKTSANVIISAGTGAAMLPLPPSRASSSAVPWGPALPSSARLGTGSRHAVPGAGYRWPSELALIFQLCRRGHLNQAATLVNAHE